MAEAASAPVVVVGSTAVGVFSAGTVIAGNANVMCQVTAIRSTARGTPGLFTASGVVIISPSVQRTATHGTHDAVAAELPI